MIERIKNVVAEGPRAAASTIHYLYLARVPFLGWITLVALPLLAIGAGRPLVLAAYDLASNGEAFFVGIAYELLVAASISPPALLPNFVRSAFDLR